MEENVVANISPCSTPSLSETSVVQDETYFFDVITFQVGNTQFRVPSTQFTENMWFETTAGRYSLVNSDLSGDVVVLDDVAKDDFKALLKVFHSPPRFTKQACLKEEEWIGVLRLSSDWGMIQVRRNAIEMILSQTKSPVLKVRVGREFDAPELLKAGHLELVKRQEPLSTLEAEKLGIDISLQIFKAREYHLKQFRLMYTSSMGRPLNTAQTIDHETGIVKKATDSEFQAVLSVPQSTDLNPVELLELARDSGVKEWIQTALYNFVQRPTFLTLRESYSLGLRDAIGICRAREAAFLEMKARLDSRGYCSTISFDYATAIREAARLLSPEDEDAVDVGQGVGSNLPLSRKKKSKKK